MLSRKVTSLVIPFVIVLLAVALFNTPLQAESPYDESSAAVAEPDLAHVDVRSNTLEKPVVQDELS